MSRGGFWIATRLGAARQHLSAARNTAGLDHESCATNFADGAEMQILRLLRAGLE